MASRFIPAAGLFVLGAAATQAQTPPTAADKAAMERAQREAEGPKRRILEASRLRVAVRAPEAAPAAPVIVPPPTAAVAEPALRSDVAEAEGDASVSILTSSAAPLPVPTDSAAMVPGVTAVAPVVLSVATPSMIAVPPAAKPAAAPLPPPRLISKVDPELSSRLLRRSAFRTEVLVELVINVDGSVSQVAIRSAPSVDFEQPVIEALRQWRYEPQPAARPHWVRLVMMPST